MPPENVPRRRLLQSAAAASGLLGVSLAGCTDLTDVGGGGGGAPGPDRDRPSYAPYIPAEGLFTDGNGEGTFGGMYVFVDFEALAEFDSLDLEDSIATPEEPIEGSRSGDLAFMAGPTLGVVVYALGMFGLIGYSFTGDLLPAFDGSTEAESNSEFETRSSVLTSFGYVFLGDYDVEALGNAAEEFEAVDEREGFTVFEGQSADDDDGFGFSLAEGMAFAASADAVLIPLFDTSDGDADAEERARRNREMVDTMVDVVSGAEQSVAEADADVDWVLRTAGHGAFGIGTYGEAREFTDDDETVVDDNLTGGQSGNESEFFDEETIQALEEIGSLIEDATVYGSDFELENESEASGHVALAYDAAEDVPSDEEFEEVFGDVQGEFSIESGETRVYLSVTQSLETADA